MFTPGVMAGIGAVGSIASGIGSSYASSAQYKIAKSQASVNAKIAKVQGEADALNLLRQFNQTQASNVVMAAAQGRSGGSVSAVASAARTQYQWDADFTKLSSQIQQVGYKGQEAQYSLASKQAMIGGTLSSVADTAMNVGTALYKIGD